jgi:hypothetical protein
MLKLSRDSDALMSETIQEFRSRDACPRCGTLPLRAWSELDDAEREIARRLYSAGAAFTLSERIARHRWCLRCWHEETGNASYEV